MITKRKKEVLKLISEKLQGKNINWCLVGSTNLALQGINLTPKDIDITTDREGAHKINELLKDYETKEIKFLDKGINAVYLAIYHINNEEIEVIGESKEKNIYLPLLKEGIIKIKIDNQEIPCLKLEKEYIAYKKLEKPEKIVLIKQKLKTIS